MFAGILNALFGCSHDHFSFPMSVRSSTQRVQAASTTGTYVACLDCGKEFPYDWKTMKVVKSVKQSDKLTRVPERAARAA
jgi:hypothetical protein